MYPNREQQEVALMDGIEEVEVLGVEECGELEDVYDFNVPKHHAFFTENVLVSNCAEFCAPPNHACNLSSLNLTAFYSRAEGFLSDKFKAAARFSIIAQDILVDISGYPNQEITDNARRYRPLGLGFTNLGGLFMNMGIAYDSDMARGWASIIAGMMTATAFLTSSELAKALGSFANYDDHRKAMLSILKTHKMKFASVVDQYGIQLPMVDEVESLWEKVFTTVSKTGVRNCMVTLVAPAGTISHMMDCSTQGIEPILYVIAKKTLASGGEMILFNPVIEEVLKNLGYSVQDREGLIKYVREHGSFEGSPIKEQHLSIFDPAYPLKVGDRHVSISGQMLMMAAVQPFISGAISKTFGLPETATASEVREIILTAWKLGLKAVSVYRDKSKMSQPVVNLLAGKGMLDDEKMRERLPDDTNARKHRVKIGSAKMYIIPSFYPDGRLGEIFINGLGMEGSTLSGMMDALLTAVSIGLQYGVPLEVYAEKFIGTSFPPKGFTSDKKIPSCTSLPDYVFRYLDMAFGNGTFCAQSDENIPKVDKEEHHRPKNPSREISTGEVCGKCGWLATRLGACLTCTNPTCSASKNGSCG
jgi:ribonucleoside-diphosphate reductase alpha chain